MALIEWNDKELGVGIKLIDNQHKMLVHLINRLSDAITNQRVNGEINAVYEQLLNYTKYHFETEETYFFRLNNQETQRHAKQHQNFVDQLSAFKMNHHDLTQVSQTLLKFLSDWLTHHIKIEDKKFVEDNTMK